MAATLLLLQVFRFKLWIVRTFKLWTAPLSGPLSAPLRPKDCSDAPQRLGAFYCPLMVSYVRIAQTSVPLDGLSGSTRVTTMGKPVTRETSEILRENVKNWL
jgi:hypothetical protein